MNVYLNERSSKRSTTPTGGRSGHDTLDRPRVWPLSSTTQATIALLTPFEDVVHIITADNGKEFAYHEQISKALSTEVYFAHPYSSSERGLNENTNGLLRQYFPKNTDFKKVEQIEVRRALRRLNSRPRKDVDFKTPAQLMDDHRAALAA